MSTYTSGFVVDLNAALETVWEALGSYRNDCIPEGVPEYDAQWGDIATAMAHISEAIGIDTSADQ